MRRGVEREIGATEKKPNPADKWESWDENAGKLNRRVLGQIGLERGETDEAEEEKKETREKRGKLDVEHVRHEKGTAL